MSSPTSNWQDRRGMFQPGRIVHEPRKPLRRPSDSLSSPTTTTSTSPLTSTSTSTSSGAIGTGLVTSKLDPTITASPKSPTTATTTAGITPAVANPVTLNASPTDAPTPIGTGTRRRSSASSQSGIFNSLFANRTSDEYQQRRQSWDEMKKEDGLSGFWSGLVNKK